MKKQYKIILSGGGTGGHIYPAVAVAEALRRRLGDAVELLFVGAEGKMEMEKVPALGYSIVGLPIAGLQRRLDWHNLGVPTLIQEQNSYAGLTNKILGKRARKICTAYEGMERFFPADRIRLTGNPLRGNFSKEGADRQAALAHYGFTAERKTLLVVGGSLGTRRLNEMMKRWIASLDGECPVQVIWQTGKYYEQEMRAFLAAHPTTNIWQGAFIDRMDLAYAADLVISRSGAGTVSELCLVAKPVLFVPSPNVAEDHQTMNARALEREGAAVVVSDAACEEEAVPQALALLKDEARLAAMRTHLERLARPRAAEDIVDEILKLL